MRGAGGSGPGCRLDSTGRVATAPRQRELAEGRGECPVSVPRASQIASYGFPYIIYQLPNYLVSLWDSSCVYTDYVTGRNYADWVNDTG